MLWDQKWQQRHVWEETFTFIPRQTDIHLMASFPGQPRWAGTRKVKAIWSRSQWVGSGISSTIYISFAPRSRQITMPASHHSTFYRLNALPDAKPAVSTYWRQSIIILTSVKSILNHLHQSLSLSSSMPASAVAPPTVPIHKVKGIKALIQI